jgi:hypothetical protein
MEPTETSMTGSFAVNPPSAPSIYCLQPNQTDMSLHDATILISAADCLLFEANYHFTTSKYEKALQIAAMCYLLNPTCKTKALELMDRCTTKINLGDTPKEFSQSSVKVSSSNVSSSNSNSNTSEPVRSNSSPPIHGNIYAEAPISTSSGVQKTDDDYIADHFLRSEDLFDMLSCKPWDPLDTIEKSFKRAIVSVHSDRNRSALATNATSKLTEEIKKFRASPAAYTKETEQKRATRGIRDPPQDPLFDRDAYGRVNLPGELGRDAIDPLSGFDRDGKRPYTWFAAAGPKRHVDCNPEMGPEATKASSLFADPRGEQAWMARIEYNDETSHKFSKTGKYQTFSEKGVSASKNGTRFIAKNK